MESLLQEAKPQSAVNSQRAAAEKYLTFRMGTESYGLAVLKVREIIRPPAIITVPRMPSEVRGVVNLRGQVIPIIDLPSKFGLGSHTPTDTTCIIVVNVIHADHGEKRIGIIVDAVEEVLTIPGAEIEPPPDFGCTVSTHYIAGMAKFKGSVKTLLDIDRVINESNLHSLEC
jgi:purine-binding chemotaxis protein CheW